MPFLPYDDQPVNPFGNPDGTKPDKLIVTRDDRSPPLSDGGRPWADMMGQEGYAKPTFGETLGASFRLENEVLGAVRALTADRDFGAEDPEHNAWDHLLKDNPKLQPHWQAFVGSRNAKETEYIRSRVEQELEDRRIREASGATGFATDMIASLASPTTLLPGGAVYKGYRSGIAALKSAASVGALAAGGVALQELALQQQQYTRTWQESMFNVAGGTVLGGLLGGGISHFASSRLARAARAIDEDLARIRTETADIAGMTRGEAQPVGAAPARVVAENIPESALGLERAFSWQSPLTRVLANEIRAARDVMTRLAEVPFRLRQNREGIATGPAGGSVEARIKIDGDVAIYRASESLAKSFAEYRYGNADAKFAKSKAAFADMLKPQQGRLGWREFKSEVTKALRSQTEKGIEHPNPQVKAAAESFRRDVFEPFKKEAQKLGLFPEDAEFSFNYVMRRYDVNAILNNYERFKQILVDHLKGGQARARAELAAVEREIAAARTDGDVTGEVDALRQQFEAERARVMEARSAQENVKASQAEDAAYLDELTRARNGEVEPRYADPTTGAAITRAEVDGLVDMWAYVRDMRRVREPQSLIEFIRSRGGIVDQGTEISTIIDGARSRPGLINRNGMTLDDAARTAWEAGFVTGTDRPTIADFLELIREDISGNRVVRAADQSIMEDIRVAREMEADFDQHGLGQVKSAEDIERYFRAPESGSGVGGAQAAPSSAQREILDAERLDVETRMADEKAAGKRSEPDDDLGPLFAGGVPISDIRKVVQAGRAYHLPDDAIVKQFDDFAPYEHILPEGSNFAAWISIRPGTVPGEAIGTVRVAGGVEHTFSGDIDTLLHARALYIPDADIIIPTQVSGGDLGGTAFASGIYHEIVHAAWVRFDPVERARLAVHADVLGVLKMDMRDVLKAVRDPDWSSFPAGRTVKEVYEQDYYHAVTDPQRRADLLAQESVAYMQEMHFNGHFRDADVAPVLDDLMHMRGNDRGYLGDASGAAETDMPLFAARADSETGQSMRRDLDALGYYSQALEAAKTFQNKGTPEQALAWLKKSGVKDAEIEATGLRAFLDGKASVTRADLVKHLEDSRVGLKEVRSREPQILRDRNGNPVSIETLERLDDAALAEIGITPEQATLHLSQLERGNHPKWRDYSLDPDNPTYRETVLHLPAERESLTAMRQRLRDMHERGELTDEQYYAQADPITKLLDGPSQDFQSGHFPEPNIIGHMMTSMTRHQGKPVYTIDQIQSDWGQKLRDGGVRDEAKIADLRRRFDDVDRKYRRESGRHPSDPVRVEVEREHGLLRAELRTAEAATPGNPLVNATDQWVNTTLRRAIRQAAEADAEYIAIPTGDTVLSYNPGNKHGMREFYGSVEFDKARLAELKSEYDRAQEAIRSGGPEVDRDFWTRAERVRDTYRVASNMDGPTQTGIVPKNLRNLLQKLDKQSPPPQRIDTLDSPSGKTNLGLGFTLFPLTDKVKRAVMDEGQPLFAARAPEGEPPRVELDPAVISAVEGLAKRLGIQMPDLRGLDLDAMMAAVSKSISDMTGMGKATGNAADLKALHARQEELRRIAYADDADLASIAEDTIDTITGVPSARGLNPYGADFLRNEYGPQGTSGPLKARTLKIPDDKIVDFLDDDIERIAMQYVRSMAPDVAIAREFGDLNMTEDLQRIADEGQALRTANPARAKEIKDAVDAAQKDIIKVAQRLRGTYNLEHDPTSFGPRAAQVVKQGNVLRLMGSVVAASISDVPKLLFVHGFRQNADLFGTLISHLDGLKMAKAEAKELSAGLEFVLSRSGQLWDAFEDMAGHTMPERALRVATNKFGRLTLMDQWNSTWKQLSGVMTMNRVLRHSVDLVNGKLNPKDLGKLAASGIDADLAARIAAQYQQHGTVYGRLFLANANEWDDPLARQALAAAVRREADITITTPGQERPLWTSGTYGSVIGQFRTFQMVSIQRTLIAGLQEMDAAKISAVAMMIGLGMLSEQLKMIIHGKENKPSRPKDLGDWMYAGLANSGVLGWLTDADQMAHKVSRGNVSLAKFAFGKDEPISRFASQNWVGALLGPTYGAALDVGNAVGAASERKLSESDIHALRRLMPYQNLFYISRALREFEEGMIDAMGVPRTQRRN